MSGPEHTKRIVVVGGGTAGWLSALILQAEAAKQGLNLSVALVESSKIPTIGVGEGTTSVFRDVLLGLGIDEAEFLAKTDATIKYGIRHRDWRRLGHVYDGPIDDPYHLADRVPDKGAWIDTFCVAAGRSVTEPHVFKALMDRNRAPVAQVGGRYVPVSPYHHAYHFDQAKVGLFLRSKAKGVDWIDGTVSGATRTDGGDIDQLVLEDGRHIDGDFYIDATGFRRLLIGQEMGADWVSYSDILPVNRAMPFWIDLSKDREIPTYTHAWAQKSGWMWQIPTAERMGCGYVYSDTHTSPDQAQAEIEQALGHPIEPRNDIKIDAGRVSEVWRGNVVAVGLASSFLEPLEATSIHGTIVALLLLARRHLAGIVAGDTARRAQYNDAISGKVDDFRDFINLHYVSERRDSAFWRDVADGFIHGRTRERIDLWATKMPQSQDFRNDLDGLPHLEELLHYPVLDGLGLLSQSVARADMAPDPAFRRFARDSVDYLRKQAASVSTQAMGHGDYLDATRVIGRAK